MRIHDEQQSIFFIGDQMSSIPIFWEAEEAKNKIKQIDKSGDIVNRWQDLDAANLAYWGLVTAYGKYGFYPQTGQINMNGTCLKLGVRKPTPDGSNVETPFFEGAISYRRRILADTTGAQQTMLAEITIGEHCLAVRLVPNFEVIYSLDNGASAS